MSAILIGETAQPRFPILGPPVERVDGQSGDVGFSIRSWPSALSLTNLKVTASRLRSCPHDCGDNVGLDFP